MKKIIIVSVLTILSTVSEFYAQGSDYHLGFRIAPRISTLGAGLEVAKGFSPNFGVGQDLIILVMDTMPPNPMYPMIWFGAKKLCHPCRLASF